MAKFDLENYATVQQRIEEFYEAFPDGFIQTQLVKLEDKEVVFQAMVFKTRQDVMDGVFVTGYARELEGASPVNKTSFLENAETSAIGRALANLGLSTNANRASRSEMMKAQRMNEELEQYIAIIVDQAAKVPDETKTKINGEEVVLKDYIRNNWDEIQTSYKKARDVSISVLAVLAALPVEAAA
jgi:hypothetical protein